MIVNRMVMVTIVSPIAINGETSAIVVDRSARCSSTSCMPRLLLLEAAAAHQEAEFFARCLRSGQRIGEMAVKHHGDAVGDLREFVEVLAGDEHRGARGRKIDQRLSDDSGGAGIDAPGRLT